MAFRASNQIQADAYRIAKNVAVGVKARIDEIIPRLQSGQGDSVDIIDRVVTFLRVSQNEFASVKSVAGIGQYAKDQESDPAYDVVAEFSAVDAAIVDVIAWAIANFPTDTNGYLLERKINPDGSFSPRVFTGATVSPFVARLQALSALIS